MYPYTKYILASILRGKPPKIILERLRAIGLADKISMAKFNKLIKDPIVKSDIAVIKSITDTEHILEHADIVDKYQIKNFLVNLTSATPVWTNCYDCLTIPLHRRFIVVLITAGYSDEVIAKEFAIKFSIDIGVKTISFFREYYWDIAKLSSRERISACEKVKDDKLRAQLLRIVDGDKHEAIAAVDSKQMPEYENILSEILADAYNNYKALVKKTDPESRAQLKTWLDVIVKIGDRHNKLKPKNTDELDALIHKLEIDKKAKEEIPAVGDFLKNNKLA